MTLQVALSALSLLVSLSAVCASVILFLKTRQNSVRPILVFTRLADDHWHLQNVGNGPALNLEVAEGHRDKGWSKTTNCDALAAGGDLVLAWLETGSRLGASYGDVYARLYHTICQNYRNDVADGPLDGIPKPSQSRFLAERRSA